MSKSVYSLVLTDQVVEAIDALAYTMGTSRSALIDRILASHVSYTTPEMRINSIFDSVSRLMEQHSGFIVQAVQAGDQMMSIRSSLKYKYKPTLRYSLQLHRSSEKTEGELKVSFRTQSAELIARMEDFLRLWAALEDKYIVKSLPDGIRYIIEDGRFTRSFTLPDSYKDKSDEEIAAAITAYIHMFDDVLKVYFAHLDSGTAAEAAVQRYGEYLKKGITII
ncbi:MAG: hypothetical protein J1F60_07980 [Oscillospiraceae bacterium]|nr:hypothetical protein [Oscillospiraceae bacterium]